MKKKELKEYFERDKKYREESMLEIINGLIIEVDYLKGDLLKNKKRLLEKPNALEGITIGQIFESVKSDIEQYHQRFNLERIAQVSKNWETSNQVIKALEHLDKEQD